MPNCIFHIPWKLDEGRASASSIRPQKMLQAFRNLGYGVATVMGSAAERKTQAADIMRRMDAGERFDFVYSESSTMPTQLTEPNHMPVSRDIDFGFFEKCRAHGVKVGLFYRDVYWKYPSYREIGLLKSSFATHYYKRDLKEYTRCIDILFVPSEQFFDVIANDVSSLAHACLPPGCEIKNEDSGIDPTWENQKSDTANEIQLLYVGGIGAHYGFDSLIEALRKAENVHAVFCVREVDFAEYCRSGELRSLDNVDVVHAQGESLVPLFAQADIALMFFDADPYQSIAIPYKTFEYVAHGLPIISNGNTAAADFISSSDVGWIADGDAASLTQLLDYLSQNPGEIAEKSKKCATAARENTWEARANTVAKLLGPQG